MSSIVKTINLCKTYGKQRVVDSFSMDIKEGHIYGLIGPNGAGKTTIMKMVAGLVSQDGGKISLFGDEKNLEKSREHMSFMIEAPYLDTSMTAYENMQYISKLRNVNDNNRICEVLKFIGLENTGKKQVKNFSLGMKQRLGIGMALLPNPKVMILDEPINGLDPEGIVDVRNKLKYLCEKESITIVISSHILSELAELCTDFIIINKGKMIETFSADELKDKCRSYIAIKTNDMDKTIDILKSNLAVCTFEMTDTGEIHLYEKIDELEQVSKTLTDGGVIITKFAVEGESLEEYYMSKVEVENE